MSRFLVCNSHRVKDEGVVCIGQCIVWGRQPEPLCKQFPLFQSRHARRVIQMRAVLVDRRSFSQQRLRWQTHRADWRSSMPSYGTPLRWLTVGVPHSGFLNQTCENSLIGTCSFFWSLINGHSYTSPTQILVLGYCRTTAIWLKALSYCTNIVSPESQLKAVHLKVDPTNILAFCRFI